MALAKQGGLLCGTSFIGNDHAFDEILIAAPDRGFNL
jgi:hypothetical protein